MNIYADAMAAPMPADEFPISPHRLSVCVARILRERCQTPSIVPQGDRTLLVTPFIQVSADELERIARLRGPSGKWMSGRYRLQFAISGKNSERSELSITSQILANPAPGAILPPLMGPGGPMRGMAVPSNGSLERRWREIMRKRCGG